MAHVAGKGALKGFEVRSTQMLIFNAELAVGFALLWPGLYYVLHKFVLKKKSPDYTRRCLCVLHWIVSFVLSTALYSEHFDVKQKIAELKFEDVAIINALVYIIFDLVWNLYYKTETPLMMVNHGVLLTTAILYIFRDTMRMVFIEGYTLITFTEPLLHIRYFLKHYGIKVTIAEYIFIAVFVIIRVGLLTFLGHKFIADGDVDNIDKALLLANYTVGLIFCINIVGYLQRKYTEAKEVGHILRGLSANAHPDTPAGSAPPPPPPPPS